MDELQLLSAVVEQYDDGKHLITPEKVADNVDGDLDRVRTCFETLESNHLLTPVSDEGFRPTVTMSLERHRLVA